MLNFDFSASFVQKKSQPQLKYGSLKNQPTNQKHPTPKTIPAAGAAGAGAVPAAGAGTGWRSGG